MSVNKAIIVGRLGRDPEVRYAQSGDPVASMSVATTHRRKNKATGDWEEETEWHRVSVFGKTAEACGKHLTKGREVYVEGRLRTRSYDDKNGVKRSTTEIVASDVQFIGGKGGSGERRADPEPYDAGAYGTSSNDDDIPF